MASKHTHLREVFAAPSFGHHSQSQRSSTVNLQRIPVDSNGRYAAVGVERNRVLRNTYALLALPMVPTVLGAWLGVSTGLFRAMGPIGALVSFAVSMGLIFMIGKQRNSAAAVPLMLGFTFFMGLMLSGLIGSGL